MTRRDYPPGEGPAAGIVYAVLISLAGIVACGAIIAIVRSLP